MATITVTMTGGDDLILASYTNTVDDSDLLLAVEYFAAARNYFPKLADGTDNPESKHDFMIRGMREYTSNVITSYAATVAADAARAEVLSNPISI